MVCDLCNASVTTSDSVRVPALTMRSAVLRGFNPFTTPGFGGASATLAFLGVSTQPAAADWKERALKDASDWLLCHKCHEAFVGLFGGA
jgi:hypothetical protein